MDRPVHPDTETMVHLAGGTFAMGSADHYPEEAPVRRVSVSPFLIDRTPVTNRQFATFVAATGYVTLAEKAPDPALYPGILPDMMVAGSIVFEAPWVAAQLSHESWWQYVPGASWRQPYGPDAGLDASESALADHPVVHIAYQDARAYARWAGKRLLTEAEAEFAARGGLEGLPFAWGSEFTPEGRLMANIWLEGFPVVRPGRAGPPYTSAVETYPANGFGLLDMIGNVWEWTSSDASGPLGNNGCCAKAPETLSPAHMKVLKGGSHLCAPNYCQRYRPAARWFQPVDTSTSHVGFRCALDDG